MSPEAQRIAIAEACGFFNVRMWSESCIASMGINAKGEYWGSLGVPDYLNDLNAMHEAEEATFCNSMLWDIFVERLCDVTEAVNVSMIDALIITNRATAAQRAEAYLRAIGKWEGGSDE